MCNSGVRFVTSRRAPEGARRLGVRLAIQSAEFDQILKHEPSRLSGHNTKGYAALIEPSEFDWSEAKLSCYRRDSSAGIGVIARYEHDLPLPLEGWVRSKLCGR